MNFPTLFLSLLLLALGNNGFYMPQLIKSRSFLSLNQRASNSNNKIRVIDIVASILNKNNKTESLLNIIAYGDNFLETSSETNYSASSITDDYSKSLSPNTITASKDFVIKVVEQTSITNNPTKNPYLAVSKAYGWSKVPGCLSDVRVKASINADSDVVRVVGVADSRVARGLLAILCNVSIITLYY